VYLSPFYPSARAFRSPFERFFAVDQPASDASADPKAAPTRIPYVEVSTGAEGYEIVAEVPGVPQDGVSLAAERGSLTLTATAPKWVWKRSFSLPDEVDVDAIAATLDAGLLTIRLPRVPASRPRQIRVEGAHH
jgi:HSP20 family protein